MSTLQKCQNPPHHEKIAIFGLEIDITKATSDLDLFRFRVSLSFRGGLL